MYLQIPLQVLLKGLVLQQLVINIGVKWYLLDLLLSWIELKSNQILSEINAQTKFLDIMVLSISEILILLNLER